MVQYKVHVRLKKVPWKTNRRENMRQANKMQITKDIHGGHELACTEFVG